MNGNCPVHTITCHKSSEEPHSLGQSVEWKHPVPGTDLDAVADPGPTRWGKQLNGNLVIILRWLTLASPTRWGNQLNGNELGQFLSLGGHKSPTRWGNQLNGNLPEYQPIALGLAARSPTRWGNQLNGNILILILILILITKPHSLGQSVEWKPPIVCYVGKLSDCKAPLAGAIS